jgi:sulfite dehydrogenase
MFNRRELLAGAGATAATVLGTGKAAASLPSVTLPFQNGTRPLVVFPQKRPLILLTPRPPQLETPFAVFDEGVLTPNDAFFTRWHLAGIPKTIDGSKHHIRVHGKIKQPLSLSIADLRTKFKSIDVVAVNQCSGNSRGLFAPRVPGGQWDNGAMGNARWTGVRLTDILAKAGLEPGVIQIRFQGLERPILPTTPPFLKSLNLTDIESNGHVIVAYEMNGQPLPWLNGYPVRLIVPGWYSTYWMKMLSSIEALDEIDQNFWMKTAYRIPDTPGNTVAPDQTGYPTIPINKMTVRSFITNVVNGASLRPGPQTIRGIAFDQGHGIKAVEFSIDGGKTWRASTLGQDYGPYSFRRWERTFDASSGRSYTLACRAVTGSGETQTTVPVWDPGGYLRNVIETYAVKVK